MRRAALLLTLVATGCSPSPGESWPVIEDFISKSTPASCVALEPPFPSSPTELVSVSDSTFLVNLGLDRETVLMDHRMQVLARVPYARQGPRTVMDPRDMTLVDDSILVYADRPALALRRFTLGGRVLPPIQLEVPPERVIPWSGGRFLVAATLLAPVQSELLFVVDTDGEAQPLGAAPRAVSDWQLRTLANIPVLLPTGPGRALAAHQFIFPAVHRISGTEVRSDSLPSPDEASERIGWVPSRPFQEEEMLGIATPVLDADLDRASGDLLVLTRSGRRTADGTSEKALIRYGADLSFRASVLLPVNAGHMVGVDAGQRVLLITDSDGWVRCQSP